MAQKKSTTTNTFRDKEGADLEEAKKAVLDRALGDRKSVV